MDKVKILEGLNKANDQIMFFKYMRLILSEGNEIEYNELKSLYDSWLKNLPYSEYLFTKEWQLIKKRKFRQAGYKCEICGVQNERLHIHHLTYENHPYPLLKDLMILCGLCHKRIHESREMKEGIEMKARIFNAFTS